MNSDEKDALNACAGGIWFIAIIVFIVFCVFMSHGCHMPVR